jgi:methyl-accepting chemotaxis protein
MAVASYAVLFLLFAAAVLAGMPPVWASAAALAVLVVFTVSAVRRIAKHSDQVGKISRLASEVYDGRFEYRITHIQRGTELGAVSWQLNDMLDQLEAMFREVKTTVDYNSQGKYFRRPQRVGLHAGFAGILDMVEQSLNRSENTDRSLKDEHAYLTMKIAEMLEQMSLFAAGDMTISMHADRDDEIGELYTGFNRAIENIRTMMQRVAEAVSAAASASAQISASAEEMAAGASQQTEQASEVAAAVEEMSQTIAESTRNARKASELANQSGKTAHTGGAVVTETIEGMNRIAEVVRQSAETVQELGKSSDQIGEIVQVIDDIADQTNLLALNAAIEAARAGEQGRGFAVVADEVRKLAERTTKATKEIAIMIKQIQKNTSGAVDSMVEGTKEVDAGKRLADNAGASLQEIITSSGSVVDTVMQLAATSEEQAKASDQISRSITSISNVTQETASGTHQIARAAEDLNQLTGNLEELVGHFKINESVKKLAGEQADVHDIHFVLESAKTAHKLWRMRVMRMLSRSEEIELKSVTSHHECKFGLWFYADGKAMFGKNPTYDKLALVHKDMHLKLKDIVAHWNGGNETAAREEAKTMYKLSDDVVKLIDQLEASAR